MIRGMKKILFGVVAVLLAACDDDTSEPGDGGLVGVVATFSVAALSGAEGNSGTSVLSFIVTRAGDLSQEVSVQAATADGSATDANNDYEPVAPTTLNFAAGETIKTFGVTINGDSTVEPNETFTVNLTNPSAGAEITTAQATGTILNDDSATGGGGVKAGVGVVDMTPDVGYGAGQYADKSPDTPTGDIDPYVTHKTQKKSYGVVSRLTARAIVVEGANGKRIALLKSDNYLAQDNLIRRVGQILAENNSSIGYDQILYSVTHAHSTTYVSTLSAGVWVFQDAYDARFFEDQARKLAQAILTAEGNMKPARMGATTVRHKIFKGQIMHAGTETTARR